MSSVALLIIDLQKTLVDAKPYRFDLILSNIRILLEAARANNTEIFFIQHTESEGEFAENSPGWQLLILPQASAHEHRLIKHFNSAFKNTGLKEQLDRSGIRDLVIVGMQTEYCIDTTVKVAFELGYQVHLPMDTHTTLDNGVLDAPTLISHTQTILKNGGFARIEALPNVLRLFSR